MPGRLVLLVGSLLMVLLAIQWTSGPRFAEQLERVFTPGQESAFEAVASGDDTSGAASAIDANAARLVPSESFDGVVDNTYLRSADEPAWEATIEAIRGAENNALAEYTVGVVSYAQLTQQPDAYRGMAVTLQGTIVRAEGIADAEELDGPRYRVWIAPDGGGRWPFVAYLLELPEGLTLGDELSLPVEATGVFFKNWSYAYDSGLGTAPLIVCRDVLIESSPAAPQVKTAPRSNFSGVMAVVGVAAASGLFAVLLWRRTTRPRTALPADLPRWPTDEAPHAAGEDSP